MCGIGGFWLPGADPAVWDRAARLGAGLRHRGPDDAGWLLAWAQACRMQAVRDLAGARSEGPPPDLVFAHRRLSIVDVEGGWQPLSNGAGTVWIAYNGEIYNHVPLRRELEAFGHRFATRSDTEMVVHAYEAWGPDAFARLNGMFAFALWDAPRRRLVLARDPLGVKPLYYGSGVRGLWFASEMKAAIAADLYVPALELGALEQYLTYRFVPSPETLFRGARRLLPGHWVAADARKLAWSAPARFAPFPARQDAKPDLMAWVERLAQATAQAVDGQRMSDVPVGALLSGGLDSSIVVALMREVQTDAVPTYAIGFSTPAADTELTVARRAAQVLGTAHHEVAVEEHCSRRPYAARPPRMRRSRPSGAGWKAPKASIPSTVCSTWTLACRWPTTSCSVPTKSRWLTRSRLAYPISTSAIWPWRSAFRLTSRSHGTPVGSSSSGWWGGGSCPPPWPGTWRPWALAGGRNAASMCRCAAGSTETLCATLRRCSRVQAQRSRSTWIA